MEKQNQRMLHIMESAAQDRFVMSEKLSELLMRNSTAKNTIEGEGSTTKEVETRKEEKKAYDNSSKIATNSKKWKC